MENRITELQRAVEDQMEIILTLRRDMKKLQAIVGKYDAARGKSSARTKNKKSKLSS